jgi:mannan polymerase II complex MNN11 subunit
MYFSCCGLKLQGVNPSNIDLICMEDKNGLNAGSFFIRNSEVMRLFVDLWSDSLLLEYSERNFRHKEQDLLLHLILEHPTLRERVGFVDQRVINSYQDMDDEAVRWHSGDLVAHFPNCV